MISVLTPSFNSENTLVRCIESVLKQGHSSFEHIIIDGGSTDSSMDIIKSYKHIKWVSESDEGQSDAMNKAFDLSSGDIIVYLNADDEFLPGIFDKVLKTFDSYGSDNDLLVVTNLYISNSYGNIIETKPSAKLSDITNPYKLRYPYNPLSYFYSRNIQSSVGKFPLKLHLAMDYWFLLRAYRISKIFHLNEVSGIFHNYSNKTSENANSELEVLFCLLSFHLKFGWFRNLMKGNIILILFLIVKKKIKI